MIKRTHFAWPVVMSAALVAAPAFAQDTMSQDGMSQTTMSQDTMQSDGWNRDQHFDGLYLQGFGAAGLLGNNNGNVEFDTNRDGSYGDTVGTVAGANAFAPGFCSGGATGVDRTNGCTNDSIGAEYGVRIGADRRMGNFVGGLLVEGSRNEVKERSTAFSSTPASYTFERSIDYAVSARARLGFTPGGGALFYGTGGVSYAKIDHDFRTTNSANSFTQNDDGDMVWGWQAGGGTEVMLTNNLSLGAEYLYSRYNDNKYNVSVGAGSAPATNPFLLDSGGTNMRVANNRFETHSLRAVLGLRF